jgi:hypothetical protein
VFSTADIAFGLLIEQYLLNPVVNEVFGITDAIFIRKVKGESTMNILFIQELSIHLCHWLTPFVVDFRRLARQEKK